MTYFIVIKIRKTHVFLDAYFPKNDSTFPEMDAGLHEDENILNTIKAGRSCIAVTHNMVIFIFAPSQLDFPVLLKMCFCKL